MDEGDLAYEAVTNAIEAGARYIRLSIRKEDGRWYYLVEDDGAGPGSGMDVFAPGFSTKGSGRGRGLSLLKERHPDASLDRRGGLTRLSWTAPEGPVDVSAMAMLFSKAWTVGAGLVIEVAFDGGAFSWCVDDFTHLGALDEGMNMAAMRKLIQSTLSFEKE